MSSVLNTNYASLVAAKNLLGAQSALANSVERLSSGLRINRAKDDAAGLGVASLITRDINGANQGIRNLNDGISMVQTAEGALIAVTEMIQRIMALASQGSNAAMGSEEREYVVRDINQLLQSIDFVADRSKFGSLVLFDGVDESDEVVSIRATASDSDDVVDISKATALRDFSLDIIGGSGVDSVFDTSGTGDYSLTAGQLAESSDADGLATFLNDSSEYLTKIINQRAELGALQQRMEYTVSNLTDLVSNLSASRSRIMDTDYAAETSALTRAQILQQAATAMLSQANQMPNVILTLLK